MVAMKERTQKLIVADNGVVSGTFNTLADEIFVAAAFPDLIASDVGIEYTMDGGTTYYPVLDPVDGADLVVLASGSDPGIIDISDFIRFAHSNEEHKMRFTFVSQTAGPLTITVLTRG